IIVCHHKVSTYFGGHLMHQSTQKQKVQGNSRLRSSEGNPVLAELRCIPSGRRKYDGLAGAHPQQSLILATE
ncbi:hypothetical protein, partial [Bradyrhizobium sp. 188]|uniref:hypothetical protein n=1 Tax=Bradyrhizobium sp. 188 TaxID=2782656 RepID=UPI001FFA2929